MDLWGKGLGVTVSFGMYMEDLPLVHCALADSGTLGVRPSAFQPQAMPPLRTGTVGEASVTCQFPMAREAEETCFQVLL